jgi:hypothetical protein
MLAAQARLAERATWQEHHGHLVVAPPRAGMRPEQDGMSYPDARRLIEAAWRAWNELAVPRAHQLCQLALACGIREEIAPIWACLLLFQAGASAAGDFLGSLPDETVVTTPQLALVKGLTLALGLGSTEEASRLLFMAAERGRSPHMMRAARAWLFAMTGQADAAAWELRALDRGDAETAVFVHATRAALTRMEDLRNETVFHLRRALASAESGSDGFPWMRPYLKASLIDALLLSGRVTDAASLARRFHAREPGAGWDLAVSLNTVMGKMTRTPTSAIPA